MQPLNILIPTDFSTVSNLAFQMADLLAEKFSVAVHLLYVIEAGDNVIAGNPDLAEAIDPTVFYQKQQKAQFNFDALRQEGKQFEQYVKIGLLTNQIHNACVELEADLVIMGTNGAQGFQEKISGSEAQQVTRRLQVPVISLRPGTQVTGLQNILLVADFEYFGKGIQINLIKQIAAAFGSTLHLLQILTEGDERYIDVISAQMKFFAEEHELENFETHLFRDQKVTEGVTNFNQEAEMDLVCIRTNGRKGIQQLLFGSIAERLVNHCTHPLLTFQLKKHA